MYRDLPNIHFSNTSGNSDLFNASITALFAVVVFVIGQLIEKMFIAPIQEQKKTIGKILYVLTFHANMVPFRNKEKKLTNFNDLKKASSELRELAANLRAVTYSIPLYRWLNNAKLVPKDSDIKEVSRCLIGWSNSIYDDTPRDRHEFRKKIAELLGVELD